MWEGDLAPEKFGPLMHPFRNSLALRNCVQKLGNSILLARGNFPVLDRCQPRGDAVSSDLASFLALDFFLFFFPWGPHSSPCLSSSAGASPRSIWRRRGRKETRLAKENGAALASTSCETRSPRIGSGWEWLCLPPSLLYYAQRRVPSSFLSLFPCIP